jgi:hypothetical protein
MNQGIKISADTVERVTKALQGETPRGTIILVVSWIDHMLKLKFMHEFRHGSAKVRDSLYGYGGAFSSLSSKIKIAYAAGWIDDDIFFDLNLLRDLRNDYAHRIEPPTMDEADAPRSLDKLKTPHRVYSDWGRMRVAEVKDGLVFYYVGEKPPEAGKDLDVPGMLSFKLGVPAVIGVLGKTLGIELSGSSGDTSLI